jgi:hypothetical protein
MGHFILPMCNKDGGNPPYTKLKITWNNLLNETMNSKRQIARPQLK